MATRTPPRFVPTLTEVVQAPPAAAQPAAAPPAAVSEEQLVRRIMQRVELQLDKRLREALAVVLLEHTRSLAPRLREEVEAAVRKAVAQAVADEAAAPPAAGR